MTPEQARLLQQAVDQGHQPWRADARRVALAFVQGRLGWTDAGSRLADPHTVKVTNPADGRVVSLQLRQPARQGDGGIWVVTGGEGSGSSRRSATFPRGDVRGRPRDLRPCPGFRQHPYRHHMPARENLEVPPHDGRRRWLGPLPQPRAHPVGAAWVAWDAWRATRGGAPAVAARQQQRLTALVEHARRGSRFYAERYRDVPAGPVDLRRLPPVTKPQLMARFDDWVTDPAVTRAGVEAFVADLGNVGADFLGRYLVFTTSGSTGVPTLLVQDRRAVAVMTALAYVRFADSLTPRLLARVLTRGARTAAIFAAGGHFLSTTMFQRRLRTRPIRRRISRFLSVLDPLPQVVEELNAFRPAAVGSYASVLAVLAEEQQAGRLRISPAVIASGGEPLSPTVRHRVEAAFGCPVLETYSASEAAPLSQPCRRGRLHVNADWFLLEPIDARGAAVHPGQRSHSVLLTNLANFVQPLIRYELGDSVVIEPDGCGCGSPLPTIRVEGRTDEVLHVPRPDGHRVSLLPMALATVVEETPHVYRFQVVQTSPRTLAVRLQTEPGRSRAGVWPDVRTRLGDYLRAQGLPDVAVELAPEPPLVNPRGGKLRHVISVVKTSSPAIVI